MILDITDKMQFHPDQWPERDVYSVYSVSCNTRVTSWVAIPLQGQDTCASERHYDDYVWTESHSSAVQSPERIDVRCCGYEDIKLTPVIKLFSFMFLFTW